MKYFKVFLHEVEAPVLCLGDFVQRGGLKMKSWHILHHYLQSLLLTSKKMGSSSRRKQQHSSGRRRFQGNQHTAVQSFHEQRKYIGKAAARPSPSSSIKSQRAKEAAVETSVAPDGASQLSNKSPSSAGAMESKAESIPDHGPNKLRYKT